jgi:carboxyl-terminal processing protease
MKKLITVLSYLTTAMAACAVTLLVTIGKTPGSTKLDQVEYLIKNRFIEEADMEKAEDAAATAMIDSLGDRWSYYLSAADYATHKEQVENAYVGIGITISPEENGQGFLILAVQKDSGAEAAGLLAGDIITGAESQDVRGMTTAQLRDIIRGKEGTSVSLEITRDSEVLRVQVTRMQILTEVVSYEMLENSIGLIAISNFDARCADETIAAIEALREQGAQALIFDVRNNPGGYATELVKVLDYLLPEGDLFRTLDYAGRETVDKSDASYLDMPIAVVCNEDSYSAAEFFPAAIQEYGAGTIVGMPTCGKGYFQYTYELSDGSAVGLSAGKYFTPSGKSLIGTGIQPDVVVEVDDETRAKIAYGTLDAKDDPQIQAAADILTK